MSKQRKGKKVQPSKAPLAPMEPQLRDLTKHAEELQNMDMDQVSCICTGIYIEKMFSSTTSRVLIAVEGCICEIGGVMLSSS